MARPTDYTPELVEKARAYIDNYPEQDDMIPSVVGLSKYIGISRTCIYDWASQDDKKEFSDILEEINSEQNRTLINKGLSGQFNSNITKLALGKHGYHDKQDTNLGGQSGNPIEGKWRIEIVDPKANTEKT
jgi:hypothetical protein